MAQDWLTDVRIYAANADEAVVAAIVKYCGISLQSRDSSLVAMSDKKERDLVRENYLKKKLGLTDADSDLDAAVLAVGERMKADRTKNRVTVYYLLAEHFGLLSVFGGAVGSGSAAPMAAAGLAGAAMATATSAAAAPIAEPVRMVSEPPAATPSYSGSSAADEDATGGGMGWLKWLLLAALLLALIFFAMHYCSPRDAAPVAPDDSAVTADATGTMGDDATATTTDAADAATVTPAAAVPTGAGVVAGMKADKPMLTVYFDSGKSDVSKDLAAVSTNVKDYLAKNPTAKLAVSGYNDPTGNAAINAELSKKRAQGVGKALEAAGIAAASIELVKPAETTDAAVDKTAARRVEVTIK